MPPERVLLVEGPCPLLEVESFVPNAEETLQAVTLHRKALVRLRQYRLWRRVLGLAGVRLESFLFLSTREHRFAIAYTAAARRDRKNGSLTS